ncbi:MAG TPA: rhomboid family intramembrane serine protease [Gemmatimonadaceae bacterium]|nr:rhomboid family intramembrane serine protease [Gemmatimonadaceae bacterium]
MTPWVRRLIIANIVVFFLEQTTRGGVIQSLALVPAYVYLKPWTIVTYMFVHANFTHILFNMLALYFFGPRVEERIGSTRFITLYTVSGISGALLSTVFAPFSAVVGASGAVFGVMLAFAMFWPTAQIYIMGILPIEARLAVFLMAGLALWSGLHGSRTGVADFAHLGGFVGGWLYLKWLDMRHGARRFRAKVAPKIPTDKLTNWKRVDPKSVHEVNRDEVNRILDKISASGLASLTPQERQFLSSFVPPDDRVPPPT